MGLLITQAKIILRNEARARGWETNNPRCDFWERYNDSQRYFLGKSGFGIFKAEENERLPKNLIKTTFVHARLETADMSGCDLQDADLRWAYMYGANLSGAKINKKALGQTDFWEGANLTNTRLYDNGELLSIEQSRKIIKEYMAKKNINVVLEEPKAKETGIFVNARKAFISTFLAIGLIATPFNIAADGDEQETDNSNNQTYEQTTQDNDTIEPV